MLQSADERLTVVGRGHVCVKRALGRPDLEAARAQRGERFATGEAGDVVTDARELAAVVAAHGPGTQTTIFTVSRYFFGGVTSVTGRSQRASKISNRRCSSRLYVSWSGQS